MLGQGGRQQEPRVSDQPIVVKGRVEAVEAVRRSHRSGAPLSGLMGVSQRHLSSSDGHLIRRLRRPSATAHRWIRAKRSHHASFSKAELADPETPLLAYRSPCPRRSKCPVDRPRQAGRPPRKSPAKRDPSPDRLAATCARDLVRCLNPIGARARTTCDPSDLRVGAPPRGPSHWRNHPCAE